MSDQQDKNVKVTLKLGPNGDFYILQADTVSEFLTMLNELKAAYDEIGEFYVGVKQAEFAKELRSSTSPSPAPSTQHSAPAAGATPGSLRCKHGAYKDLLGKKNARGELYKNRYACPAPYVAGGNPDQCKSLPGQEPNREV